MKSSFLFILLFIAVVNLAYSLPIVFVNCKDNVPIGGCPENKKCICKSKINDCRHVACPLFIYHVLCENGVPVDKNTLKNYNTCCSKNYRCIERVKPVEK